MLIVPCEQGSVEWIAARLGKPTASRFDSIVTPTGKPCSNERTRAYMYELLAERALGCPADETRSQWMTRGSQEELDAVKWYEFTQSVNTEAVGFCTTDDGRAGCSPDRLVGTTGGLEIKCPSAPNHVGNLLGNPKEYKAQVQGCMWVTGREWWHRLTYNARMPSAVTEVARDETFIDDLAEAVDAFCNALDEAWSRLVEDYGFTLAPPYGVVCRERLPDGRWCMSGEGLTLQRGRYVCEKHATSAC